MNDYYSAAIFGLIGFLTSFFSKNMIVILFIAIAFTNIIKYGAKAGVEGMTVEGNEESKESEVEQEESEEEKYKVKVVSASEAKKKGSSEEKESLSVETNEGTNKEKFGEDKVVYTSEEDKELAKTDKMILSQEKILKSMNKYKPLLDTLNGITKNMAIVKGASSATDD
jgi:hypothetical protein